MGFSDFVYLLMTALSICFVVVVFQACHSRHFIQTNMALSTVTANTLDSSVINLGDQVNLISVFTDYQPVWSRVNYRDISKMSVSINKLNKCAHFQLEKGLGNIK